LPIDKAARLDARNLSYSELRLNQSDSAISSQNIRRQRVKYGLINHNDYLINLNDVETLGKDINSGYDSNEIDKVRYLFESDIYIIISRGHKNTYARTYVCTWQADYSTHWVSLTSISFLSIL
jgi:hypothetical protein